MEGFDYNSSTGTWVRNAQRPPPLPPKELDLVKETQSSEANSSGRGSLDSQNYRYAPAENYGVMRPVSAPKRKVRILSLDGGGIRGYSTLVILGELMHQVYVQENGGKPPKTPNDLPRPCDYFDLIGGNGTGGLLALMLGRMRMDVESCKNYYVELTRFVFITDKTLLGMPYGKTLFKASRLEEAIKHCVRESTRFDADKIIPHSPPPAQDAPRLAHKRTDSWRRKNRNSSSSIDRGSEERGRTGRPRRNVGNPDAPLLDAREGACKTFVTTMLQGSRKGAQPVLLRSYPSPAESMPSYRTTIWQAGRATCATASAFKAITIDQTQFLDEGGGMYNPAFQVLDEAHIHEFPDCEIGCFVSVGTGKRQKPANAPPDKHEWWEGIAFEGFAEAKRRLIRRIDDCERVHRELVEGVDGGRPRLAQGGVAREDYYRFNVEVGVGEFGMNEWNRLSEVATGTRRYLGQRETNKLVKECAGKLVSIEHQNVDEGMKVKFKPSKPGSGDGFVAELPTQPPSLENHPYFIHQQQQQQQQQAQQKQPPQPQPEHQRRPSHPPPQSQRPITQPAATPQPQRRPSHPPPQQQQSAPRRPQQAVVPPPPQVVMPDEKIYTSPIRQRAPTIPLVPPESSKPQQAAQAPQNGAVIDPTKPGKQGKVLVPSDPSPNYYSDDPPNPEIRVTSPTTVAGGSDDEDEDMYKGYGRRRRRRSRSKNRSLAGVME